DRATTPAFQIALGGRLFQPKSHVANFACRLLRPGGAERRTVDRFHRVFSRARGAIDDTCLAKRLALPELSTRVKVLEQPIDRQCEGSTFSGGAQPRVDFVESAE